jgi:hypothetical protein|tara:strand:+ start:171 stop:416 length:246 start_codon:yes stop_codon:yes gene_type:complete
MNLDIQIGDTILTGRFKNKRIVVKDFGVDDKGQPTINGRPILKFRIEKLMPSKEDKKEVNVFDGVIKKHVSKAVKKQINKR